jgi:hypothetical protein
MTSRRYRETGAKSGAAVGQGMESLCKTLKIMV